MANNKGIPDFSKIKEKVRFDDVLSHYGLMDKLKRKGDQLTGSCPIHKGEGKSCFSVSLARKCFNCFSCKAHGNVLDFVAAMEKVDMRTAGKLLSEWFSIPLETGRVERKSGERQKEKEPPAFVPHFCGTTDEVTLVRERKGSKEEIKEVEGSKEQKSTHLLLLNSKTLMQDIVILKKEGFLKRLSSFLVWAFAQKDFKRGGW